MPDASSLDPAGLDDALSTLGDVLEFRGYAYELVLVGGANLVIQGVVSRPTKDGDLVGERLPDGQVAQLSQMPAPLEEAVADVARTLGLATNWLNVGPAPLMDLGLPDGFESRLSRKTYGTLVLWLAGIFDMVCFKLYASADEWPTRGRHLQDLLALRPDQEDFDRAARWCVTHDPSPSFAQLLDAVMRDVRNQMSHA
jgi:hypothetical protein